MPIVSHASEADVELFRRELDSFVPDIVCDAHMHLWTKSGLPPTGYDTFRELEEDVIDLAAYRRRMAELLPGRRVAGGLILPGAVGAPTAEVRSQNELVAAEAVAEGGWRGSMLISPEMDPEYVRQEVRRLGLVGLKCYHVRSEQETPATAAQPATWNADIPAYLPEAQVRVAHEEGLCITLHMVKARAVADPSNQYWIRHYCETYPDMRLILAHAARGFNPYHTIEGLAALRGLPNLWCDMAAITDPGACEAIIEILGHDRLLYGTDFPVSHLRGRCVAIGDGFVWLYDDTLDWNTASFQPLQPVFVGLESLRVLKQAAWHCRLGDRQVEDIFCNNVRRLLGIR
jgi:predicted TIM-barrel fold metal-dependent hydrolase